MLWLKRLANSILFRRRKRRRSSDDCLDGYRPKFRRLEDRRVLDVSAAFATATGQLEILISNTADTANISTSNGEMVITNRQNQAVAIQVDGGGPGTVSASKVDSVSVRGDATADQTVVFHSPLPLPKGMVIDSAIERAEIRAAITRVSAGDIRSDARLTQLGADIEVSGNDITFGGAVRLASDVQLTAENVTFGGDVDDDANNATSSQLLVIASGLTRFADDVGASSPLTRIETDAAGRTELNGDVTASGGTVIFSDPVTLTSNVSITDNGPTGIVFGSTVDSAANGRFDLTLSAANGRVEFNGDIGAGTVNDRRLGELVIEQAASGVIFGNTGAVTLVNVHENVDVGQNAVIGGDGILLNGGASVFQLNLFGGQLRFNGALRMRTDVILNAQANIIFTAATPIDSDVDRTQSLTIDSSGNVLFNEDIGANVPLRGLLIPRAGTVTFGGADTENAANRGPVERIRSVDAVRIGSGANPTMGVVFNAGDGQSLQLSTTGDDVVLHGLVTLASSLDMDTGTGPGDIFFGSGEIFSQDGETNDLVLRAGTGNIAFSGNIGFREALGSLTITQADGGVSFGTADSLNVATGQGPVERVLVAGAINVGSDANEIVGTGIGLNGGVAGTFFLTSINSDIRLNGIVRLETDVNISSGGDITFTNDAPIDSQPGEVNDLTFDAPAGVISFNEDIGRAVPIGRLTVFEARDGLVLGGATTELPGSGGLGPVEVLRAEGSIALNQRLNEVGGQGIRLSGSAIAGQKISTTGDSIRLHGAVTLATDVDISTQGGEILFTNAASIDSASGRTGSLSLDAGTAAIRFNEDLGAVRRIGSLTVTRADGGVRFGESNAELLFRDSGPVNLIQTDQPIDLGVGNTILAGGILFQGGGLGTTVSTTDDQIRFNGAVKLATTNVSISTGDGIGDILFTSAATIDSNDGFGIVTTGGRVNLTLDAGDGGISFNANIGAIQPLNRFQILRAAQTVVFGGADVPVVAGPGPVTEVRTTGGIDIGAGSSADNIIGEVIFNGGVPSIILSTNGNDLRLNGKTTLQSPIFLDTSTGTGTGAGDLIFTAAATIDSQTGEENFLEVAIDAGDAIFNAAIGSTSRVGSIQLHQVANAQFVSSITAAGVIQDAGTGKTTFQGNINTNDPFFFGLLLIGHEFEFQAPVLATGSGRVDIRHSGLLDLNAAADMRLDGIFFEDGGGSVDLAASIATSGDTITFNGPVRLTDGTLGNILLSTVAGGGADGQDIHFVNSLNGQTAGVENLLLNAGLTGDIDFNGPVGNLVRLGSITILEANNVDFDQSLGATRIVQIAGEGTTTFNGAVALNHPSLPAMAVNTENVQFRRVVQTEGEGSVLVTVRGLLDLGASAVFNLTGTFHQQGTGVVRNGADIVTSGSDVLFDSMVTLTDNVFIRIGQVSGRVVFAKELDGVQPLGQDLRIFAMTGDLSFLGAVGGTIPLDTITIERADDVFIRAPVVVGSFVQQAGTGRTLIEDDIESRMFNGTISVRNRFIEVQGNLFGGESSIVLKADEDLVIGGNLNTDTIIRLTSDNDLFIGATSVIVTRIGQIVLMADGDTTGGGEVRMADGALIESLISTIQVNATDNITLARLVSPHPILLTSTAGGIVDAGDTGGINIEAPALATRTATGVGTSNIIETKISTLAALNTGAGGIQLTNNVGGLLTIGDVDGLGGLIDGGSGKIEIINRGAMNIDRAIRNGGGGDTFLRAEFPGGNLTVNQPIQNTGGDGFIVMFAGGDLAIHNSLPEPRDAQGNQIEYPANPEQFFEIYAVGQGGVRGEAVGKVRIDNGEQNFVIVHTDTGQITNVRPILTIETVDQGGSDVDEFGRAFVKVTLGDEVHFETNYQVTIDWGDGEIEHFPIPGTINPLRLQFKGNTDPRFVSGVEGEEGVYTFLHKYFFNPNVNDPSAPIIIRVEARHDPRSSGNAAIDGNRPASGSGVFNGIRFFENVAEEIFTSKTDFFTLPGIGGLGFVKVVEGVIVPVELRAPTVEPPLRAAPSFTGSFGTTYESVTVSFESGAQEEYRVFMRVVDDVLGTESEDIPLDLSVLEDPVAIFRKTRFPNGHYRIYLEELRTRRIRVILDVYIYNGRVVPPDFRAGAAEKPVGAEEKPASQPQPNQNGALWETNGANDAFVAAASDTRSFSKVARILRRQNNNNENINSEIPSSSAIRELGTTEVKLIAFE